MTAELPPGQRDIGEFPRYGVPAFAARLPDTGAIALAIEADLSAPVVLGAADLEKLPRREVVADFHCVATWTKRGLTWSGWSLADVYTAFIAPRAGASARFIEARALDGYKSCLALEDALQGGVLLADRLDGSPLGRDHGAPLRLVAPEHYGYKSVKHLSGLALRAEYRAGYAERQTRAHPRARVALEERGRWLPGWIYRYLYRAAFRPTLWIYRRAAGGR